jgi:RNA polymerase sigma factor (sigma-70 family)
MLISPDGPTTSPTLLTSLADWQNEEAWRAFAERYIPYIDGCAARCGLQEADVLEVRSRVLTSIANAIRSFGYDPTKRFRGYIQVCVRNTVKSYLKEIRKRPGSVGLGGTVTEFSEESEMISAEVEELAAELDTRTRNDLERLWRIMEVAKERLSPVTWQAFELTRLKGLEAAEAAKQLGISLATLYVYRGRTLELLKKIAAEQELDDEAL